MDPPNPMITVEKAAKGYKVLPRDVLEWIEAGNAYFGQFDHLIRFMPIARYA
jgi:hypothetical protein